MKTTKSKKRKRAAAVACTDWFGIEYLRPGSTRWRKCIGPFWRFNLKWRAKQMCEMAEEYPANGWRGTKYRIMQNNKLSGGGDKH